MGRIIMTVMTRDFVCRSFRQSNHFSWNRQHACFVPNPNAFLYGRYSPFHVTVRHMSWYRMVACDDSKIHTLLPEITPSASAETHATTLNNTILQANVLSTSEMKVAGLGSFYTPVG